MASKYLTPEEKDALKMVTRATAGRRPMQHRYMDQNRYASTACFHSTVLKPWMRMYAEWLALQPGRPGRAEKTAVANRLAHDKVSRKALIHLEQRTDFIEYYDKFAAGAVTAARAKLEAESPWYVEQHRLGLERAIQERDYKAIPNYTGPVIERVWPRRESGDGSTPAITINLSVRQAADLERPPSDVLEAEIIEEPKELPPG